MSELGLVLVQPLVVIDGKQLLRTEITDSEDGAMLVSSNMILPDIADPQKLGSAITYFRRYSLQSLLSLEAEDDDGNATQHAPQAPKPRLEAPFPTEEVQTVVPVKNTATSEVYTCKQCGLAMKLVPAGVSKKTGRAYESFWTCPKGCQQ